MKHSLEELNILAYVSSAIDLEIIWEIRRDIIKIIYLKNTLNNNNKSNTERNELNLIRTLFCKKK